MAAVSIPVRLGAGLANINSPPMKPLRGKLLSECSPANSVASTSAPTPMSLRAALPSFADDIDSDTDSALEAREDDWVDFADGTTWHVARGQDAPTLLDLFRGLGHVQKLYQRKFGYVDSHNDDDLVKFRDTTSWLVSRGWREPPTVDAMQQEIKELKLLFTEVFHDDVEIVDDEFIEFQDGSKWTVSHGRVPPTLESLETQLAEVWDQYVETMYWDADWIMLQFGSSGKSTTTRNKRVKLADGTSWDVARGRHPPTLSSLEEQLEAIKELFKKFEPACVENVMPSKPTVTKLGAVSTDEGPRRHGIFDATQFGRATRSDRKVSKVDWVLGRNQAPVLDRTVHDAEAITKTEGPTKRHYTEPKNGAGRRMRRSTRYQAILRQEKAERDRERRNRKVDMCIARRGKFLDNSE